MYISIINGPNLNLLGIREPHIYGGTTLEEINTGLEKRFEGIIELRFYQSNSEGDIIDAIQSSGLDEDCKGIVINPGGYSHYSVSISDALGGVEAPAVEVHLTNIHAREDFRHKSVTAASCRGVIAGLGFQGYELAIEFLLKNGR